MATKDEPDRYTMTTVSGESAMNVVFRRIAPLIVAISSGLLVVENRSFGQPDAERSEPERIRELDGMIEALANRKNPAPKVVKTGRDSLPVFEDNYDPEEQRRVKQALLELNKRVGN